MRFSTFLLPLIAAIFTTGSTSATTYRVSIKSSLEEFAFLDYGLNTNGHNGMGVTYVVDGANDPVLENYPYPHFLHNVFSAEGSARFTEFFPGDGSIGYLGSDCTGVLGHGNCRWSSGRLTGSYIDLANSDGMGGSITKISALAGTIIYQNDYGEYWSNALGSHGIYGESVTHRIEGISISQVPVPASGLLMLLSFVGFGAVRRMHRR